VRALPTEQYEVTIDAATIAAFHRDGSASIERSTTDAEVQTTPAPTDEPDARPWVDQGRAAWASRARYQTTP
jgi:hypothetical protein